MQKAKKYAGKAIYILLLVIFIAVMVFPFYWLVLTSFKDPKDISLMPTELWPSRFSLKFFNYAFTEHHLEIYLLNSVVVALGAMGLTILFAFPAAYAFSRIRFKFKKFWRNVILLANMFPIIAVVTPMFIIFRKMHLINTYWGLIVPSVIITLPMAIWTLQAFIDTLPKDLE
ncbi:MAG: carbohydrate ABC transporter permease [Lachnospiraceae bacterium]|nr:carbohydrate ABC transporter permease [Lachnospiraceae bacterium]